MKYWVWFGLWILLELCDAAKAPHYECGPHGRFEYCIDGIPGCVVGCHCHPGYYFDTETKICEPNVRLTNDYRRHYYLEPTRMPVARESDAISPPIQTTKRPIDAKVDAIAQDADDLGDWLYNQFFKTIENQVINKTENEPLTRRSGSVIQPAQPVPKRRSRRRQKKKSKSKRKMLGKRFKGKGLKKKLLRITEDDSLFDSSSDDSDDFSSSSDSFSDTSMDTDSDDKDHGHRKILMINKKPTPALPSFIFLPNMETPYYPPIGLPPPPIMPMYPMVPVPPVGPFYGQTIIEKEPAKKEKANDSSTKTENPTTSTTTVSSPTTETTTTTSSTTSESTPEALRGKDNFEDYPNNLASHRGQRNKLMRLRNKMKKRNKKLPMPPPMDAPQDPDPAYFNDPESHLPMQYRPQTYDDVPPLEDVDFKYLSELIHKVDFNKTQPKLPHNPNEKPRHKIDLSKIDLSQYNIDIANIDPSLSRRNLEPQNSPPPDYSQVHKPTRPASKADELGESFYSDLGKQIAGLIRKKVDGDAGTTQFDIEIDQVNQKSPMHAVFNENSPRSYWERFVRSPLQPREFYDREMNHIEHSSEHLFNLEDQVNVATAIERVLSLGELENIAFTMVNRRNQEPKHLMKPTRNPISRHDKNVNINLLPPIRRRNHKGTQLNHNKSYLIPNTDKNVSKTNHVQTTIERNMVGFNSFKTPPTKSIAYQDTIYKSHNNTLPNLRDSVKDISNHEAFSKIFKSPRISPLHHQVSRIVQRNISITNAISAQNPVKYQLNPVMVNYKFNYAGSNRNQYHPQQSMIQLPMYSHHTAFKPKKTYNRPSYFHHEFHHFDYFDNI